MDLEYHTDPPEFPMERPNPFDPPLEYARMRAERPVTRVTLWNGGHAWLITRYDDVRAVLRDRRFSAVASAPGYPHVTPGREVTNRQEPSFIAMDPPEHDRQRKMVLPDFMVRPVEAMRPQIQAVVDDLIDRLAERTPPADLVCEFALPVPSTVICQLLGVPYEDRDFFHDRAAVPLSGAEPSVAAAAYQELRDYLAALTAKKAEAPEDDVLSSLGREQRRGALTPSEVSSIALLLLVAGHETTANMIALGTFTLLQHPDQLEDLRTTTDTAVSAGAAEELLRYLTIVQYSPARFATEDVEVGGEVIKAGDGVFPLIASANRDERIFTDPDSFDIHRRAGQHVAFGHGVHQCLGQWLARVELEVVFATLFRRLPNLQLAVPVAEIPFKYDMTVFGVHALPVRW